MDRKTKVFLTVLLDFVLLGIIIFSTYKMTTGFDNTIANKAFSIIIYVSIPIMFYCTYMTFAGEKYTYDSKEFDDIEEDEETNEEVSYDEEIVEEIVEEIDKGDI